MDLWVRSQDKLALTKVNSIGIEYDKKLVGYGNICVKLGEYKTKERALEVLDEIQSRITRNEALKTMMPSVSTLKGYEEKFGELFKEMVYEMPED
jgi:hypothetical protein